MARKKTATKHTAIAEELASSHDRAIAHCRGDCLFIYTKQGWESYEGCVEPLKCRCSHYPPKIERIVKPGEAFVVTCERYMIILSEGFVTFQSGFEIDPFHADDYCVAISERPGKWRYFHHGANRHRDQNKGHLDALLLERGVIRLDRLNSDGTESIELGAIGLIEPNFSCNPSIKKELERYRSKKSGSE